MRIYHNIPATTAYNALNATNNQLESSIQKLSTGLRINSASDDAAGFAISEKMRSQISGLEMAIRNAQDGVSMLQTAEGALGETNSLLQRMRELAVQASNDTLTSQDRSYIQLEIDQIKDQVDRIANTTQFNKKRLLDGSSAGTVSTSNLSVKAFVRGSLREIDQFGQKKSFEGNYKIRIKVDPNQTGQGQVQKSTIMTIKHPDVITDTSINSTDGITKVAVDELPAANFIVDASTSPLSVDGNSYISAAYGFTRNAEGLRISAEDGSSVEDDDASTETRALLAAEVEDMFDISAENAINNASILFEITSVTDNNIILKAQSNILGVDGSVNSYVKENIRIGRNDEGELLGDVDLSDLLGESDYVKQSEDDDEGDDPHLTFNMGASVSTDLSYKDIFTKGAKFVLTVVGNGGDLDDNADTEDTSPDISVTVQAKLDPDWPYTWKSENVVDDETNETTYYVCRNDGEGEDIRGITYNLNSVEARNKEIHFRNYYLNGENGTVYQGDVIITTNESFEIHNDGDELASFTTAYIGKTATGDTKLRDLNTFWNTSGVFMLDDPQSITIIQGDGQSTSITLYATDTLNDVQTKFNNAIANDLGQAQYINAAEADKFCTFVEKTQGVDMPTQGLETVPGTFIFRSLLAGDAGNLTFSGDEDLINKLAFNVVRESSAAAFMASIYDAHTGTPVATNVKVSDNHLIGVLHENIDIEFNAMAGIKAAWSESEENFILESDTTPYEAVVHIVDSSTIYQIGANEGEDIAIDIGNMTAASLGVSGVNVTTREAASKAVGLVDAAINKVSTQRAKIGAFQNSLEYTISNLTTTSSNLTAAESRIRDADMAQEMMNFVKYQILNQSGTSMLAQANQLPQSVLSLLQ